MKAIQVQKTGGPEVLTLVDVPVPKPKDNEALVKIAAIGVNFIDVYFREGRYPAQLPFIDGQEAAFAALLPELGRLAQSEDHDEYFRALQEKRAPAYRGR